MKIRSFVACALLPLALVGRGQAEVCDVNDPTLLKPDLVALPPSRVRVLQRGTTRRVIFATKIANLGKGPLIIQGKTINTPSGPVTEATQVIKRSNGGECDYPAGTFEFHVSHNHFHLNDFSSYEIYKGTPLVGSPVAKSDKISFCVADIEMVRGNNSQRQVLAQCGTQEGVQGISVGWADVYDNYLPEQWVDVDPSVPAGAYFLTNVADPDNLLLEENESHESNAGSVSVSIPALIGAATGPLPTATATSAVPSPTVPGVRTPVTRPTRLPRPGRMDRPVRPDRAPRPTPIRTR